VSARATTRPPLAAWYAAHGRHHLPWRADRDRWPVLVSEVMLQQTQVGRVLAAWPAFIGRFPTPDAMAVVPVGEVITAWDRLGYPRRAVRLRAAAGVVATDGWPDDLATLPGVGRYTAGAIRAQADDADVPAVEVNVRRVVQRVDGVLLGQRAAEAASVRIGRGMTGRDRLLALMDLGATVCTARDPGCGRCPLRRRCRTRGPLAGEVRVRQTAFEGSFRQRRGRVMARLRFEPRVPTSELDDVVLASLVADGLARVDGTSACLP
jgi:A/G-specific adenine glycosylase